MLVNGAGVCEAMAAEAHAAGVSAHVVSTELEGEASFVGRHLAELAASLRPRRLAGRGPVCPGRLRRRIHRDPRVERLRGVVRRGGTEPGGRRGGGPSS